MGGCERASERALNGARTTTDRWELLKGWSALQPCMEMKEIWILFDHFAL